MQRWLGIITLTLSTLYLSGCSVFSDNQLRSVSFPGVYRIGIQQGNVVDQDMVNKLRPNMTKRQVLFIMGTPLIVDTFDQSRWDYIYSNQPGGKQRTQKQISLFFNKEDRLSGFNGDYFPVPKAPIEIKEQNSSTEQQSTQAE